MSKTLKHSLVFGGGRQLLEVDQIEQELDELDTRRDSESIQSGSRKPSAYVEVFEGIKRKAYVYNVSEHISSYGQHCS